MGICNAGIARLGALHPDSTLQHEAPAGIDLVRAERAVRDLLVALGRDVAEDGLRDTPRRVAGAYADLLLHEPVSLTTFPNDAAYDVRVQVPGGTGVTR